MMFKQNINFSFDRVPHEIKTRQTGALMLT